jgi:NTE family protein
MQRHQGNGEGASMTASKGNGRSGPAVQWTAAAIVMAGVLFWINAGAAQTLPQDQGAERPKVGLALSGGGARGAAHIGVLKVLEEMRVPIDFIAGTSMGSIVGGLYASGMTPSEIEHTVQTMDWSSIFDDRPPRETRSFRRKRDDDSYLIDVKPGFGDGKLKFPLGAIQGQKFDLALRELALPVSAIEDFDRLHIPFRAVATDIATGEAVVIGNGDLAQAMRASMAVPGAFAPTRIDGRLLVDGGISNNLPISVIREMGADIIIAVDISTPYHTAEAITNLFMITGQLTSIMTRKNVEAQLATLSDQDVLIVPELGDIGSAQFERAAETVAIGQAAAQEKREALAALSLSESDYARQLAARAPRPSGEMPVIGFIRIENQSKLDDQVLIQRISIQEGEPLDTTELETNLATIFGLGLFESVNYTLVEEDGETGVVIQARERGWGPNYLQFGLTLSSDSRGESSWNVGMAYLRTAVNPLGGEIRTALQVGDEPGLGIEWYQPLEISSKWFVHPRFSLGRSEVGFFSPDGENELASYEVDSYLIDLAGGRDLGNFGEGRVGYRLRSGDIDLQRGTLEFPEGSFTDAKLYGRFAVDTLNRADWPTGGQLGFIEYATARESLGGDTDFDQVSATLNHFSTFGANTVGFLGSVNSTVDGTAPVQDRFRLGGFLHLSGFVQDSLSGQQSGLATLVAYRRYEPLPIFSWFAGASLEYGGVWEDSGDLFDDGFAAGSLFLGADTPVGPLYLGYGLAEGGNNSLFLYLGSPF